MNSGESLPDDSERDEGAARPAGGAMPAFTLTADRAPSLPVLIAVPHAGRAYPPGLLARMRDPGRTPIRLEDRCVDLLGAAVASRTGAALLVAHAPRALIDLNRAPDDVDWGMIEGGGQAGRGQGRRAGSGLGLIPRRLSGQGELWKQTLPRADLSARIEQVHRPYHEALASQLDELRDRWGAALLLDLHSMPPLGPKHGTRAAPDFVVGDRFGAACDAGLSALALDHFARGGRGVAHNRPYAGGYVLDRHARPARGIHAMQIEVCRTAYLDRAMREPGTGFAAVADMLAGLVQRLADELPGTFRLAQAAE